MFVQFIHGRSAEPEELHAAFESWLVDLAPGADGWLGTTAGVTADGDCLAVVRFADAEAARINSHRAEQHQWWMETSKLFAGDVTFRDSVQADTFLAGGSDEAGFVQVITGHAADPDRIFELERLAEAAFRHHRPELIGGLHVLYHDRFLTDSAYFTSEAEAREGERKPPPPDLVAVYGQLEQIYTDQRYYDLRDPWLYSPPT